MLHEFFAKGIDGVTAESSIRYIQGANLIDPIQVAGWVEPERHGVYVCRAVIGESQSGHRTTFALIHP
jgi:hypothetical protein